ncbi:alpha/beta hydrolase [Amycolatopsis sp. H20-H5]|uniref:alpha/beta hydrolase n=1 Tax=Amycolatopsis sp. H20-H5 TaxID=3046309 RepID=UPI002DBE23FB|nr:alpha/beta hydrolase [Amycolatopsis sp. H20-H5]MEC3981548.1 alpha/beta hydrolase [Amycolatopsis sp. H20-H5]
MVTMLVSAVLAGCTAGPSVRPAVVENDGKPRPNVPPAAQPAPLPPLAEPQSPSIKWSDCDADTRERLGSPAVPDSLKFSCARVATTLDAPDLPGRGLARISVLKVGTGTIPLAVVNDVDGEPGSLYTARLAATLPPAFLQKFFLVGVDRRGTGASAPVQCIPGPVRRDLLGGDPAAQDLEPVLDAARKAGQQCAIELDNAQVALDSWRGAGDLDELRKALGLERLNALGHGDGSKVLADYAVRYPGQVGRVVLDGLPDPGADTAAVLDAVAAGAQTTLDAFAADCVSRGCSLGDPKAALTAVADRLRTSPAVSEDGAEFGPGIALYAVYAGLGQRSRWPELADAITAARAGNVDGLQAFAAPFLLDSRAKPTRLDGTIATRCNDSATRLPADEITKVAGVMKGKYPQFGTVLAQQLAWCSPWPVRREALPPAGAAGAPPILVASTAADPMTPEQGTVRAADQMPSAVTISWQGAGHGAFSTSPCVTDAASAFLTDGKIPVDGTLCPA